MRFLAQDKFYSAVTSPDGTKYAVSYMTDRQIKVFSADGNLLAVVPPGEDPWMLAKWFNNEQILLTIIKPLEGVNYEVYPRDMVILNPFTQEQQRISSDYPDFDLANNRLYWAEGGTTAYDPTVTKVVYPGSVEKNVGGYILWDRIQEKKLWTLGNGHYMATPKWSPDGTQFVVINTDSDAFSFVSRDGEIARVVSINPNEPRTPSRFFYTSELYSWSPDGRYLSFWLEKITKSTSETNSANLAIYDLVTGSITDTCILFGSFQGSLSFFQAPIWSPDGKYIVTLANWQKDGPFDTLMIDLEAGFAVEIGESLTPNGWLSGEE
jgi:DNA-binding beta-propeller fold protein YncE